MRMIWSKNFPRYIPKLVASFSAILAMGYGAKLLKAYIRRRRLLQAIAKYQGERAEHFEALRAHLTAVSTEEDRKEYNRIVQMDFEELQEALQSDTLTPLKVLRAFQWAALRAQEVTNCLTLFFHGTEQIARDLEAKFGGGKTASEKPALYGIPVSVKDNINIKGESSTLGLVQRIGLRAEDDSQTIKTLRRLGAIPFVGTNLSQICGSFSSANPVNGNTTNPYGRARTSGGSSGGEGALVGNGGSILGFGSDILGSIRIPSHFCGISGFRPTTGRMSKMGIQLANPGVQVISVAQGPMARAPQTVATVLRELWNCSSDDGNVLFEDPQVTPLSFNDASFNSDRPMRIGYYLNDGIIEPSPVMQRAVTEAKELLEAAGHTLVPWRPGEMPGAYLMALHILNIDGGTGSRRLLSSDIKEPTFGHIQTTWTSLINQFLPIRC